MKIKILVFFVVFCSTWSFSQTKNLKSNILSTIQTYCLDSLQTDTLVIKSGKDIGLGTVYSYIKIYKNDSYFFIQNFNLEQHKEGKLWVTNLIPDSEHKVFKEDFLFLLESEMLNCKYHKIKPDYNWNYEIQWHEKQNESFVDHFGYSLFNLFDLLKTDKPIDDYFCKSNLKWIETTSLIEKYNDLETKFDTIITEEVICENGDFIIKTTKDTQNETKNVWTVNKLVTRDSSSNFVTKANTTEDETKYYHQFIYGINYSYSISYDINWSVRSINFYQKSKHNKYNLISQLRPSNNQGRNKVDYIEDEVKNIFGIFKKYKNYNLLDGKLELKNIATKALGKTKNYRIDGDGKKILDSKTITKRQKQVFIKYDRIGEVSSKRIQILDKQNRTITYLVYSSQYDENKLMTKIENKYKEAVGVEAEKHYQKMIENSL